MSMQEEPNMMYLRVYPDVYYKVQPFVMMVCDGMDANNYAMPTQEMIRKTSDQIYEDVCRLHPDLADRDHYREMSFEAASAYELTDNFVRSQQFFRGGFFNDLIDIMLLNELFRRRRRF